MVTFSYYSRYSDSEITEYIRGSLVYFTKRRYKKTFYLNSSNAVVALNGANPTTEEGNIIAIVTAINIDPKNTTVRTPEFTISSVENKSRSEQINEVFDQFLRSYGTVSFLQTDEE